MSTGSDALGNDHALTESVLEEALELLESEARAERMKAIVWPFVSSDATAIRAAARARGYRESFANYPGNTGTGDLRYTTTNGSVTVELPESFDADLDLGTTNGSLRTRFMRCAASSRGAWPSTAGIRAWRTSRRSGPAAGPS